MRSVALVASSLVLALVVWQWLRPRPVVRTEVPTPSPVVAVPSAPGGKGPGPRPELKALFAGPRAPLAAPPKGDISPECLAFWNELRALDLTRAGARPSGAGCTAMPPALAAWHARYLQSCVAPPSPDAALACESALYSYRAQITEELTAKTPVQELSDRKVLGDKLLARLNAGEEGKPSPAAIGEVAERLLQIDPDSSAAGQALLMARLMDARHAEGKPDDRRWHQVEDAIEQNARLGGADVRQTLEAKLMVDRLRYADPQRAAERALEIEKTQPQLGIGSYYRAWSEFQGGNAQRAQELLREAMRREPGDGRFRETLEQMKSGNPDPFRPDPLHFSLNPAAG